MPAFFYIYFSVIFDDSDYEEDATATFSAAAVAIAAADYNELKSHYENNKIKLHSLLLPSCKQQTVYLSHILLFGVLKPFSPTLLCVILITCD